jgi:WD40 repeat protein
LRSAILKLRADFPGTPEAREAAGLFMQLPSPMDQFKPEEITADLKWPGQPRQVVAVLVKRGPRQVRCIAVSPDCKWLVYAGDDQTVHLVDTRTRAERELKGHTTSVQGVAFSPDGRTLASTGSDGIVKFWDPATGNDLGKQLTPKIEGGGRHLAFSPDGSILATTTGNKVVLWDWNAADPLVKATLAGGGYGIADLVFASDGRSIIVADNTPSVQVRDIATGAARATFSPPKGTSVFRIAISPDGQSVAAACRDCLRVWDIDGTERRWPTRKPVGGALDWSAIYDPNGRLISANMTSIEVIGSMGQTVDAWKTPWQISFAVLAPDGRHLAMFTGAGIVIFRLNAK